jgi:hypothetical protein
MSKSLLKVFIFAGLLSPLSISLILPSTASALEVPASWQFKKISTAHFDVIYDARQQPLGELYAAQAEKAFSFLSPVFSSTPEKTLIIVNDKTDSTNGYATRIPYPHIMIYPVLPGPHESLSESGDWSLELIAHEYTHILTFEPASGIFKTLRGVFGTISAPNLLLPNWWKEGLAVEIESSLGTDGGRLKSHYQDATVRAMAADNTLRNYSIAQVNESQPAWPEGMRPYLFGSLFWTEAVQKAGMSGADRLNAEHGGHVPFMLDGPAQEVFHKSYEQVYLDALYEADVRAKAQIEALEKVPTTPLKPLGLDAKYSSAPAISADGKYMAMITVDYKSDRVMDIFVRDPETNAITKKLKVEIKSEEPPLSPTTKQDGPPTGSIQKIAWLHHSPRLVFDQLHYVNRIERYSDLSIYDLATQKTQRLTHSLRAREPAVSPDDTKIAFVKLEGGRTALGLFDMATSTSEILFTPALEERISAPTFINASTVAFALRDAHGKEELRRIDLVTKQVTPLLTGFTQARFPVMTKRGLIFTSSENGVHNLYLASADLQWARPISHVLTMTSLSDLDPVTDNIYTTVMTSTGTQVVRIEKPDWENTPHTLPKVTPMFADHFAKPLTQSADYKPLTSFEVSDYHASDYLLPRYWIPYLWTSPEGGLVVQAITSGFDPLQKHSYSAMVDWDTYARSSDWSLGYLNNVTSLPVQLLGSQTHSYLVTPENRTDDTLASVSVLPELFTLSEKLSVEIGWRYLERQFTGTDKTKRTGPFTNFIYRNFTQGGEQFTPETGYGAYLAAANYIDGKGLTPHSQFQAGGVYYFSPFLPKLHSFMLRTSLLYTPEHLSSIYGTQSEGLDYSALDLEAKFLARGYSSGQFYGRNMYNANFEYRFPVQDFYYGSGTTPLFWRRLFGAAIVDAIATDGAAYEMPSGIPYAVNASQVFYSYGLEAHLETTIGYEFPITAVLGVYQGANKRYAPDPTVGLALQFSAF